MFIIVLLSDKLNFLQLDNAKFHKNIDWLENIIPIFQRNYSRELNPIERFWLELKRSLGWENCKNLEDLRQKVLTALLHFDQMAFASLTGWDYLTQAILSATS